MISFESDYIAGAHPEVLKRLTETNLNPCRDMALIRTAKVRRERSVRPLVCRRRRYIS